MKILTAEDEPTTRMMLESLLTKWGDEVISVGDGDAAFEILKKKDAPRLHY